MMLTFNSAIQPRPLHHDQESRKGQASTCPLLLWSTQTDSHFEFTKKSVLNLVKLLSYCITISYLNMFSNNLKQQLDWQMLRRFRMARSILILTF